MLLEPLPPANDFRCWSAKRSPGRAVPTLRERAGCGTTTVIAPGELSAALDDALAVKRPWLIEVITDPEAHPPIQSLMGRSTINNLRNGS
jgi:thiamine pyrophosphate-dependent acetolactate synthase large subunit-like protein